MNNKKKFSLIVAAIVAFIVLICAYNYFFPLGKYVYLDFHSICHTKSDCKGIYVAADRIESERLRNINTSGWGFCSKCVNDRQYEEITNK